MEYEEEKKSASDMKQTLRGRRAPGLLAPDLAGLPGLSANRSDYLRTPRHAILDQLDYIAERMASLVPEHEWVGIVCYWLESLDAQARDMEYDADKIQSQVYGVLRYRMDAGSW